MAGSNLGFAGLAMQAIGTVAGGFAQAGQLRASAAVDDTNAQRTLLQGAFSEQALDARERATSGEALAAEGGSGLQTGTGSAYDLLYQNALERQRAVLNTRFSAATQADSLTTAAAQKRAAAGSAVVGSLLTAGTQAIYGYQGMQDQQKLRDASAVWRARTVPGGYSMPIPTTPAGSSSSGGGGIWNVPAASLPPIWKDF